MTFSLAEIKSAWEAYSKGQMLEVLHKGQKIYRERGEIIPPGATSAAVVWTRKAMGFPEYLETKWKR